jgi:hypothetical protein
MPDRHDPPAPTYRKGILGDLPDLDDPRPKANYPKIAAAPGLEVEARGTGVRGVVVSIGKGLVTIRGTDGRDRQARLGEGLFMVKGKRVTLVPPTAPPSSGAGTTRTASGSVAVANAPARIARASRIMVEGLHDAELVEKVWGDDLRVEGVVIELLDGADNLADVVARFGPRPNRRLGILLDHLVDGSKESRLAAGIHHPDVLVTGHPFVDVWAAINPAVVGLDAWPEVPKGQSWKDGVCAAIGEPNPGLFWKRLRNSVTSWTDLAPPLVGAVEQLIDFVTVESA